MTDDVTDRRAELIAAALASELTPGEAAELDALRAEDPTIDADLADFGVILGSVRSVGTWDERAPSAELRAGVEGIADAEHASTRAMDAREAGGAGRTDGSLGDDDSRRGDGPLHAVDAPSAPAADRGDRRFAARRAVLAAGVAACIALGVGGGVLLATPAAPPEGPAGALGAVESVSFDGEPSGVDVDGDVIAHTWGTETVLTIDGLPAGDVYDVVVLDGSGAEWSAGTFLGSEVTISCRMNASVLREDAVQVQVRSDDGTPIASAALPSVTD